MVISKIFISSRLRKITLFQKPIYDAYYTISKYSKQVNITFLKKNLDTLFCMVAEVRLLMLL